MVLKELSLVNFKNYSEADLQFSKQVNCFVGDNGEGKTNLLDAIYYLSFCKSFFNPVDSQNILNDEQFFVVQGAFEQEEEQDVVYCGMKRNQKKQFKKNKKEYERLADHIGQFPVVMIAPYDQELITGGSEKRRKFVDSIIAQYDRRYLDDLITYNKALSQRNSLLRQFAEKGNFDKSALEIWDMQLEERGTRISATRKEFLQTFLEAFNDLYRMISGEKEKVELVYRSQLEGKDFGQLFQDHLEKDRILKYTTAGIHKDDLEFRIEGRQVKKFGSQGQQKSFLIALKLAQFQHIKSIKGVTPILLLDDIFDKLDTSRTKHLMQLVSDNVFGQIFMTDTGGDRVQKVFEGINTELRLYQVKQGNVQQWTEEKISNP